MPERDPGRDRLLHASGDMQTFLDALDATAERPRQPDQQRNRLELNPEDVERDLARLT